MLTGPSPEVPWNSGHPRPHHARVLRCCSTGFVKSLESETMGGSCGILLVVNGDGTVSVLGDTSVGTYDGADDTLVGIVNESGKPVPAVTVTGPGSGLSGFDSDGLCSYLGCSNGLTGYEGPGTSFVTDPSLPDSAEVNFSQTAQGLPDGATAYFSLEGALTSAELTARKGHLDPIAATVLFVHGVDESSSDDVFHTLFAKVTAAVPSVSITHYDYFQDEAGRLSGGSCDPSDPGQSGVSMPANVAGLPFDASQNNPARCDSEGDLGQNAVRLEQVIKDSYQRTGKKVILVGYSMGGEVIRSFLALSTSTNDGVATSMVDSVVTIHGVQQGSWLALGSPLLQGTLAGPLDWFIHHWAPNPARPATQQFNPTGTYLNWVHAHSTSLPAIPYYNTWGDERAATRHCFFSWCLTGPNSNFGDVVLQPGTDAPTQNQWLGGERFAPTGYTASSWQWDERNQMYWDPISDPLEIGLAQNLFNAPQQHSNITSQQSNIQVADCKDGASIAVDEELARVLIARLRGNTYTCNPSAPH